eukprot:1187301-Prorocentrum_minimum.AAC.1
MAEAPALEEATGVPGDGDGASEAVYDVLYEPLEVGETGGALPECYVGGDIVFGSKQMPVFLGRLLVALNKLAN